MLPQRPLLLLGDITGLLWAGVFILLVLFLGFMVFIIRAGKQNFIDKASSPQGKERRLLLLLLLAPFLALFMLYTLLVGF